MAHDRRSTPWRLDRRAAGARSVLSLCVAFALISSAASAAPRRDRSEACQDEPEQCVNAHRMAPSGDSLAGHVIVSGSVAAAWPTGKLEADVSQRQLISTAGTVAALDLAYGFGSWFTVGAWWQYGRFGAGPSCPGCIASTLGIGVDLGYHPLGVRRFDPFVTAGLGYRSTAIGNGLSPDITYSGFEWLRLQSGMDYYPFDHVGFGAFVELDAGNFLHRANTPLASTAAHEQLLLGGRVSFDALSRL